jgi:hypothetical protein
MFSLLAPKPIQIKGYRKITTESVKHTQLQPSYRKTALRDLVRGFSHTPKHKNAALPAANREIFNQSLFDILGNFFIDRPLIFTYLQTFLQTI